MVWVGCRLNPLGAVRVVSSMDRRTAGSIPALGSNRRVDRRLCASCRKRRETAVAEVVVAFAAVIFLCGFVVVCNMLLFRYFDEEEKPEHATAIPAFRGG